ncbi:MAG: phosphocholine cytidylyltransferase family protein [Prevotella sp.]|nr:phosphocholine cytidylyltransferase family protein [Prevotella sp.]
MIGVILAAGMAKRLRPLTDTKPKCLLEVGGRTLLERTVRAMQQAGITEFVVVTGYRGEMIRSFLETLDNSENTEHSGKGRGMLHFTFLHNADYEHNNNIYSLWMAGKVVRGKEFMLMDSDILCDPAAVVRIAQQSESALALNRHECGEEEIKVIVDADNRIVEINKTCNPALAIGESVGIEKMTADYSKALYDELDRMIQQEGLIDVFYERCFERLIPQGYTFRVVDTTQYFSYELDTPEDFQRAQELIPRELL